MDSEFNPGPDGGSAGTESQVNGLRYKLSKRGNETQETAGGELIGPGDKREAVQ